MLEDRVRRVDGVAVREWGEADWPTAVLWHAVGPLASGAYGRELAHALVGRRWRLLAPDAPGYGLTPPRAPGALSPVAENPGAATPTSACPYGISTVSIT